MDVRKAVRQYIAKMVSDGSGMKVMLLDKDTATIVSMVYSHSEILQKEVYLIERVDVPNREPMSHLKCIVFVRPTPESIQALVEELKSPKYGSYELYFSNMLTSPQLEQLAHADQTEVVKQVQEVFADYFAVNHNHFTLNIVGCLHASSAWVSKALTRTTEGVLSLLLSLKLNPVIRFAAKSEACHRLAGNVAYAIEREAELFNFRRTHDAPPLLLIVDRRDDPVTPLLNQWTYQAMVHELVGITNSRVDMKGVPGVPKDLAEIVLSTDSDAFFKKNQYSNFGEIGENIRTLVAEFQQRTKSQENIQSISDMKAFVESYPQFKQMSGTVSKHVTLVGELSRLVDVGELLDVSEVEQMIACQSNHSDVVARVRTLLLDDKVSDVNKTRLVLLYALRYETHSSCALAEFTETLFREGVTEDLRKLVRSISLFAGSGVDERQSDLFGSKGAKALFKHIKSSVKGVENIYTQHTPLIGSILDQLQKGKLKEAAYPFSKGRMTERAQDVILFLVGGTTFEEEYAISKFNDENPAMRVVLAGTCVHNADSFFEEISAFSRTAASSSSSSSSAARHGRKYG